VQHNYYSLTSRDLDELHFAVSWPVSFLILIALGRSVSKLPKATRSQFTGFVSNLRRADLSLRLMIAPSSTIPASCHKQGLPIRSCGFALNNSVCSKRFLLCNNKPRTRRPIHTGYPQTSLNGAYFAAKQAEYETQVSFQGEGRLGKFASVPIRWL
jgi:hypothetical protein